MSPIALSPFADLPGSRVGEAPSQTRWGRGVAALGILVCLVVVSTLAATLAHQLWLRVRDAQQERYLIQADWLVASAIDRAVYRIRENADYQGEVWEIPENELPGGLRGVVRTAIKQDGGKLRFLVLEVKILLNEKIVVSETRQVTLP
ncbi:hypothetical protein [Thermogutta sp.]|uniref:hypothetical protein n=1 Tax=Thermogutta sp. TaxID=1962930 RepID=UPI00321FA423